MFDPLIVFNCSPENNGAIHGFHFQYRSWPGGRSGRTRVARSCSNQL